MTYTSISFRETQLHVMAYYYGKMSYMCTYGKMVLKKLSTATTRAAGNFDPCESKWNHLPIQLWCEIGCNGMVYVQTARTVAVYICKINYLK